jgi:cytochrome b561
VIRNSERDYGAVAIALHWVVALAVTGLFALGLWMVELTYYDPWYRQAPHLHKSLGVTLFVVVMLRLLWRSVNAAPAFEPGVSPLERRLARTAHLLLYLLLFAVMASGYLISTADGRPVEVFGLFSVPATLTGLPNQEDLAGDVHFVLAVSLVGLAGLHALGALKHHFLDRDRTLVRMLRVRPAADRHRTQPIEETRR